jgi:hypothetical protein
MKRIAYSLVVVGAVTGMVARVASASGQPDGAAAPVSVAKIPSGYRNWRLISVAHEECNLNDIRATHYSP